MLHSLGLEDRKRDFVCIFSTQEAWEIRRRRYVLKLQDFSIRGVALAESPSHRFCFVKGSDALEVNVELTTIYAT